MSLEAYKQNEKALELAHTLTAENDQRAARYLELTLEGVMEPMQAFLDAIGHYAKGGTCLDLGMSYGAQYYGLKKFHPSVTWHGCEIAGKYLPKFQLMTGNEDVKNPSHIFPVVDYGDLSIFPDDSFDVVTSRSALCHYTPEKGFAIIDEMLRVASRAVIIKFYQLPTEEEDRYVEGFANMQGRGYFVFWSKPKWDSYIKGKKVSSFNYPSVIVIEK